MIVTLELRAASRCGQCGTLNAFPGLRNRVTCRNCAAEIRHRVLKTDTGIHPLFGGYHDAVAEATILLRDAPDPQDLRDEREDDDDPVELRRVAAPACRACDALLPLPADGDASVRCPGCADDVPVRWPDDETRDWDRRVRCVIGDGKGRGEAPREQVAGAVVGCGRCGAPIASNDKTDRRRLRVCDHCGASNHLPDAAWLALFPEPAWHRCYLVYTVTQRELLQLYTWLDNGNGWYWLEDDQKARIAGERAGVEAVIRAERVAALASGQFTADDLVSVFTAPALGPDEAAAVDARVDDAFREAHGAYAAPALVARWARSPSAGTRRLAARHPATGAATLDALAADPDETVRVEVAMRPETSPAVLATLRKDPSPAVGAAARKNPSYKPGFFERLFG